VGGEEMTMTLPLKNNTCFNFMFFFQSGLLNFCITSKVTTSQPRTSNHVVAKQQATSNSEHPKQKWSMVSSIMLRVHTKLPTLKVNDYL
jgi:hypothetical protein